MTIICVFCSDIISPSLPRRFSNFPLNQQPNKTKLPTRLRYFSGYTLHFRRFSWRHNNTMDNESVSHACPVEFIEFCLTRPDIITIVSVLGNVTSLVRISGIGLRQTHLRVYVGDESQPRNIVIIIIYNY